MREFLKARWNEVRVVFGHPIFIAAITANLIHAGHVAGYGPWPAMIIVFVVVLGLGYSERSQSKIARRAVDELKLTVQLLEKGTELMTQMRRHLEALKRKVEDAKEQKDN